MAKVLFLVCRAAFTNYGELERSAYSSEFSYTPKGLCQDRTTAEAWARAAEQELRQSLSPFSLGIDLDRITSLGGHGFRKRLAELQIPEVDNMPPNDEPWGGDWARWWARVADRLTDEQRNAVWDLFDRLKLVEVHEVKVAAAGEERPGKGQ
jgi:hypothetical protein